MARRAHRPWLPERLYDRFVRLDPSTPRFDEILKAQIDAFQPTILYNHDPSGVAPARLRAILPRDCALVGQIASPRSPDIDWSAYDLMVSSLPNFVAAFRREGVTAEYLPLPSSPGYSRISRPPAAIFRSPSSVVFHLPTASA